MAAADFSVLMTWADAGLAINETYYLTGDLESAPAAFWETIKELYKLRSLMMGSDVTPVRVRVSQIGLRRAYANADPAWVSVVPMGPPVVIANLGPTPPPGVGATQDGSADQAPAAITTDCYSSIQSHCRKFLAGVPDVMIRTNPTGPWVVGVPSWLTAFNNYANFLTTSPSWKFRARILPSVAGYGPVQIETGGLNGILGLPEIDLPTLTALGAKPIGKEIQILETEMISKAYTSMNGLWKVYSTAASATPGNTVYTLNSKRQVTPTNVLNWGTAQVVGYDLYLYASVQLNKQTTHKRGNRSLAGPGRRTRRATVSS